MISLFFLNENSWLDFLLKFTKICVLILDDENLKAAGRKEEKKGVERSGVESYSLMFTETRIVSDFV